MPAPFLLARCGPAIQGGTRKKPTPPSPCSVPTSSHFTLKSAPIRCANGEAEVHLNQGHLAYRPRSRFCFSCSSALGPQAFPHAVPQARGASQLGQTYSSSRVQLVCPFVQAKVLFCPRPLPCSCPVVPVRLGLRAPYLQHLPASWQSVLSKGLWNQARGRPERHHLQDAFLGPNQTFPLHQELCWPCS